MKWLRAGFAAITWTVRSVLFLCLVAVSAVIGILLSNYASYSEEFHPPEVYGVNQPLIGAKIVDRNGNLLYQYIDESKGVRLPVSLDEVSPAFLAATIATEDASFYSNPGVNFRGLARAGWENFGPEAEGSVDGTGGSSITQQLVKNLYIAPEKRTERVLDRKVREIVYALELTKRYDKAQLLEWYVNQISYGGLYLGIEAASQGYFGKPASQLNLAEATLLAGVPQAPGQLEPRGHLEGAIARRNEVLNLMAQHLVIQTGPESFYEIDAAAIEAARAEVPAIQEAVFPVQAPHFVFTYVGPLLEQLLGRDALLNGGLTVTTSLDLELQERSNVILNHWINQFERISNTHNGATMVMDPMTGEILVMLGSRDYYQDNVSGNVNNLMAPNSPGSSFKPFVYLDGIATKNWNTETIFLDVPITFVESNGVAFSPTDPIKTLQGPISMRNALGNSLNITAFRAALDLGVPSIVQFAKRMGFTDLNNQYGPSIAIGGIDLKAFDLVRGYSVIANGGRMVGQNMFAPESTDETMLQPVSILKIEDSEGRVVFDIADHRETSQVVDARQAYMITDMLSDPSAQCLTFGCGGITIPGYQVGVKTGTSEPFDPAGPNRGKIGETWAFGFTRDYAVGVWAGNSDNAPIVNIFSTSISYRAMRDILLAAYSGRQQTPFVRP